MSESCVLIADRQQIATFVDALFKHAEPGTYVALRAFRDDKKNAPPFDLTYIKIGSDLESLIDAACDLATRAAQAPYPVVFCPPIGTFKSKSAKQNQLAQGLVLAIDCDQNPRAALRILTDILGPPTVVVESGGQWTNPKTREVENKLHLYWRLSTPTTTDEEHEWLRLARSIACDLVGADASSKSPVHPIRWPGSWHRKSEPCLCTIIEQNDTEIDLKEALEELQGRAAMFDEPTSPNRNSTTRSSGALPMLTVAQLMDCAERIPNSHEPWEAWNRIGMAFWKASDGSDGGFAAFDRWSQKSAKYLFETTAERWKHYASSPPTRIGAGTLVFRARRAKQTPPVSNETPPPQDFTGSEADHDEVDLTKELRKTRLTDTGNAKRFARRHGCDVRYIAAHGRWYRWDGTRWMHDSRRSVYELAKATAVSIWSEVQNAKTTNLREAISRWAKQSESRSRIESMLVLAQSEPQIATISEAMNANPWLLNVSNGTVNLQSGKLEKHRREDLITKLAPCKLGTESATPLWQDFLNLIFADQADLIAYVQRAVGYSLAGDTGEHVVFICHGDGENGKSTFLNTLVALLGEYAVAADPDLLMQARGDKHPTGLARLNGARLVTAIESEEGRSFAESQLKWMTGGDRLTARYMREDFFEFDPTHKIWLATNHKPIIRGTDHAIWRRINLIPFAVNIPKVRPKIKGFTDMLKAEWPGILRWAVEGCLAWQREGLNPPLAVQAATQNYRNEMDVVGKFLAERCESCPGATIGAGDLYAAFVGWCGATGEVPVTQKTFGARLTERSYVRKHTNKGDIYVDLDWVKGEGS